MGTCCEAVAVEAACASLEAREARPPAAAVPGRDCRGVLWPPPPPTLAGTLLLLKACDDWPPAVV